MVAKGGLEGCEYQGIFNSESMKQGRYSQQWTTLARWWWILMLLPVLLCPSLPAETKEQTAKVHAIYKRVFPVGVYPNKDGLNSLTGDERQLLIEGLRSSSAVLKGDAGKPSLFARFGCAS